MKMLFHMASMHFFSNQAKFPNSSNLVKRAMTRFSYAFFVMCAVFFSAAAHADPLKIEVSAKATILLNAETGAILYEKNAHQLMYPASITKISTAMYAIEKKGHALDEKVLASADAVTAVHPHVRRA